MKKSVPRTRCSGQWTEAQYRGFVRSLLRGGSLKWPPRNEAIQNAFVRRGTNPRTGRLCKLHKCAICSGLFTQSDMKVDHKKPIVDPTVGFTSWDDFIYNLFCEVENLQAVCSPCHDRKTKVERMVACGTISRKALRQRVRKNLHGVQK